MQHEKTYLSHFEAAGVLITDLRENENDATALAETIGAMKRVEAIAQATLAHGCWFGRADVLTRSRHRTAKYAAGARTASCESLSNALITPAIRLAESSIVVRKLRASGSISGPADSDANCA